MFNPEKMQKSGPERMPEVFAGLNDVYDQ